MVSLSTQQHIPKTQITKNVFLSQYHNRFQNISYFLLANLRGSLGVIFKGVLKWNEKLQQKNTVAKHSRKVFWKVLFSEQNKIHFLLRVNFVK